MAAKAGRRAAQAASRSGGFLTSLSKSRLGRKAIIPAMTSIGLASELSAAQARERQRTDATQIARTLDPAKLAASSGNPNLGAGSERARTEARRQKARTPKAHDRLSKTAIHPLPLMMNTSARLGAEQQRDAFANASNTAADEKPLLELPTRSYAHPDETEADKAHAHQEQMEKTKASLLGSSSEPGADGASAATPTSSAERRMSDAADEEADTTQQQMILTAQEQDARAMEMAQQQEQARRASDARNAAEFARTTISSNELENIRRLQNLWRMVKGAELATSEAILPFIMLSIQMNAQLVNEYFFHVKAIPPLAPAEKAATGCINCAACFSVFSGCGLFLAIIAIAYWGKENAFEAFSVLSDLLF